jgi:hypothetical protein
MDIKPVLIGQESRSCLIENPAFLPKIRNAKHEIRNNDQKKNVQMKKSIGFFWRYDQQDGYSMYLFVPFRHSIFEFVSDLDIRFSDSARTGLSL